MCKYCVEKSQQSVKCLPDRQMFIETEENENKIIVSVDVVCIAAFKINYCPMCGRDLNEQKK